MELSSLASARGINGPVRPRPPQPPSPRSSDAGEQPFAEALAAVPAGADEAQPASAPFPAAKSVAARDTIDAKGAAGGAAADGPQPDAETHRADGKLREKFQEFVGQTLFGSMLAAMRKTVGKPAYLHGGRTEDVFQKQLDQHIVKDLTEASAGEIADPMYDLFTMQRSR